MGKFKVGDTVTPTASKYTTGLPAGSVGTEGNLKPVDSTKVFNTVSKPEHYNHSEGIECIEYIKQVLGKEGFVSYCRGNLMKYNHRAMYKGKPVEDLKKAEQYLKWSIETLEEIENEKD